MPKVGRPPVLDDKKKSEVLTLLTVGCSQVVAARYVGCCARTIRRTAQQDPEFGQKFRDARTSAERADRAPSRGIAGQALFGARPHGSSSAPCRSATPPAAPT